MNSKSSPPKWGRRLLPAVIDELARDEPSRPWASIPIDDSDLSHGYEDVSYNTFANAINKLAWFIVNSIGRSSTFETIAYLGTPDIRYHMIQMASCKTGHKVLFSSQLNSLDVHLSLMKQTECKALFSAAGVRVDDILAERPMANATVPDLDELLDSEDRAPPFPYTKTYEEAAQDPYLILHSSGTTGDPKPIVSNHAVAAALDSHQLLPDVDGYTHYLELSAAGDGVRCLLVTSPYHAMSAQYAMNLSVFGGGVFVPGFRHRGVQASDIYAIIENANATKAILTPWMMEDIARNPNAKDYIQGFEKVSFGGAVLSDFALRVWAKYTNIHNVWGATEVCAPPLLEGSNEDAAYVFFDTVNGGVEFRKLDAEHVADDGSLTDVYEMVLTMKPESAHLAGWHARQGITAESKPPYPEHRMGDLWTPHPDPKKAKYAWRFAGRIDDLVTFSTGVNMQPGPMERAVSADNLVSAAMVVGRNRQQPLLLVELAQGVQPKDASGLWEAVVQPQNAKVPAHARISRTHIVYIPAGGFVRTPKGSVGKKQTERKFAKEIDAVYEKFGDKWQDGCERFGSITRTLDVKHIVSSSGTVVGVVASSVTLAGVAIKIGGAVFKLKGLWDEIQDVPQAIAYLMKQIEIADSIVWEMENEMKEHARFNPMIFDDTAMRNSTELCRHAVQNLINLADDLRVQIDAQRKIKRGIAKVKVRLKKEVLAEHEKQLQDAFRILIAAQQSYMISLILGHITTRRTDVTAEDSTFQQTSKELILPIIVISNTQASKATLFVSNSLVGSQPRLGIFK
ncbi:hypothetical protein DL767_002411 [Monosporascus sp. MG133]|nr:hypothetical protein DL767_002411 [Monosporascus sp. MG133]